MFAPRPKPMPVNYDLSVPSRIESHEAAKAEAEAEAQLAFGETDATPLDAETQAVIDAVFGDSVGDGERVSAENGGDVGDTREETS